MVYVAPPRPLLERPAGFVGTLVHTLTSGGLEDIRWGTVPVGAALGPLSQVRNLERLYRATSRMGVPVIRTAAVGGVHPERYAVEFIDPATLRAGRVVAPMGDPTTLALVISGTGGAPPPPPTMGPPHLILAMLRALLQQGRTPR